jgi:hypothetical protein
MDNTSMNPTVIKTIHKVGVRAIFRSGLSGWLSWDSWGVDRDGAGSGAMRTEARCAW